VKKRDGIKSVKNQESPGRGNESLSPMLKYGKKGEGREQGKPGCWEKSQEVRLCLKLKRVPAFPIPADVTPSVNDKMSAFHGNNSGPARAAEKNNRTPR